MAEEDAGKLNAKIALLERQVAEAREEANNWRKNAAAADENDNNNNDAPLESAALLKEALRSRDDEITFLKNQLQHQQLEKESLVAKKLSEYEELAGKMAEIDGERRSVVEEKQRLADQLDEMRQRLGRQQNDVKTTREQTEEKLCLSEDEIHRLHKELEQVEENVEEMEKANAKLKEEVEARAEAFQQEEAVLKMRYEQAKDEVEAEAMARVKGIESDLNKTHLTMAEVTKILNDTLHLASKNATAAAELPSSSSSSKTAGGNHQAKVNALIQGLKAAKEAIETPPTDAYVDFSSVALTHLAEKMLRDGGGGGGGEASGMTALSETEKLNAIRLQLSAEAAILAQMARCLKRGDSEWLNERQ